jgi:hypothetical protein
MYEDKWTTTDEKDFINNLGRLRTGQPSKKRLELLQNYKDTMQKRQDWGDVNRMMVLFYVENEIRKLTIQAVEPLPAHS